MLKKGMFAIDDIDNAMKHYGYYATLKLKYNAFIGLLSFGSRKASVGQDIFAVCLEGPPGSGKTEYAKTYTKLVKEIWNGDVQLVDYQCDATTGKTELFEDINISAAISGDATKVNIPGKFIEAIKKVNDGKKVVLFIDEYDKAREETDAFLLQFLQSGKINSIQHGDLQVKEEYKSNLQLILCKNDMREKLSGPLTRRIRVITLDYMLPDTFYTVAKRKLIEDATDDSKVDEGILNLVSLLYNSAYNGRKLFSRLPSCSELLIAIQDADNLLKYANAPKDIVYSTIIEIMFKDKDDIKTFESQIAKDNDSKLRDLVKEMCSSTTKDADPANLTDLIARTVLKSKTKQLDEKIQEYDIKIQELKSFVEEQTQKFDALEKEKRRAIDKINVDENTFVSNNVKPTSIGNFYDTSKYIRRGQSVFNDDENNWVEVANLKFSSSVSNLTINNLINHAPENDVVVYEDGFLIDTLMQYKLIMARDCDKDGKNIVRFYANTMLLQSTSLLKINNVVKTLSELSGDKDFSLNYQCLIYNDSELKDAYFGQSNSMENVYAFYPTINSLKNIEDFENNYKEMLIVSNNNAFFEASSRILNSQVKTKKNNLSGGQA